MSTGVAERVKKRVVEAMKERSRRETWEMGGRAETQVGFEARIRLIFENYGYFSDVLGFSVQA